MTLSKEISATLFAAWIAENYPELYEELAKHVPNAPKQNLSGFTDFLKNVGSTIGNVATNVVSGLSTGIKSVGTFLASQEGAQTLTSLASAYTAINQATIQTQAARAQTGQAPAVIETRYDTATQSYVPIYSPDGKVAYNVNGQLLSSLAPSFFRQYGLWLILGGAGLLFVYLFLRRN